MTERRAEITLSAMERALPVPDKNIVGNWAGPGSLDLQALQARIAQALDEPLDYPPLSRIVVPGDRAVLVLDPRTPGWPHVVSSILERLADAGVERDAMAVLGPPGYERPDSRLLPLDIAWFNHAPDDRSQLAYLSNTTSGRRVYLNRQLVEADVVIPIGWLCERDGFGLSGPWSALFPAASDEETLEDLKRSVAGKRASQQDSLGDRVEESVEVGWLLGARFQVAVLPGVDGPADVLAGDVGKLVEECDRRYRQTWTFTAPEAGADLVVLSIGDAAHPGGWEEITRAMVEARTLLAPGGKLVIASRVVEPPGPALRHLAEQEEPATAVRSLAAFKDQPDYLAALRLARFGRTGPIGLLSGLPGELVEDLGFVPLSDPSEIERMLLKAQAACVVNRADLTRIQASDENHG